MGARRSGRTILGSLAMFFLVVWTHTDAGAAAFNNNDVNGNHTPETQITPVRTVGIGGERWTNTLAPAASIGAGARAADIAQLRAEFPTWTFINAAALRGALNVAHDDAFLTPPESPADPGNGASCTLAAGGPFDCFRIDYVTLGNVNPVAPNLLRWIQMIDTNAPAAAGAPRPYTDGQPNGGLPFYYTPAEHATFSGAGTGPPLQFLDKPQRPFPLNRAGVTWRARLYLVEWNGRNPGTVYIHDGVQWGFDLGCVAINQVPSTYLAGGVDRDKPTTEDGVGSEPPSGPPSLECQTDVCGNGVVESGELCDPPGTGGGCSPGFVCNHDCTACVAPCSTGADCDDGDPCTADTCDSAGAGFVCDHMPLTGPACDDGRPCTTNDVCRNGICVGGPPPDCDDQNSCTGDHCTSVGGAFVCQHDAIAGPCDDGNRCTTGDTCIDAACVGTPDLTTCHFQCYEVKPSTFAAGTVSLVDEFGSSAVRVQRPRRLCAPADKNGEDPSAPAALDHLEGYRVRGAFANAVGQRVEDQFGVHMVDVTALDQLFVPTAKSFGGTPPALSDPAIDHFDCYKVRKARGAAPFAARTVTVEDQFGTTSISLKRPFRLCAPVDKNGETPGAQRHPVHLLCYRTGQTPFPTLFPFTTNQFGYQEPILIHRRELCVPAVLNPACGNGVVEPSEQCDPAMPDSPYCPGSSPMGSFVTCHDDCTCSPSGAFLDASASPF